MALCCFSFQKRSLCIVSQNHKLKSLCPISLAKSSSLHLHLSSVVFASLGFDLPLLSVSRSTHVSPNFIPSNPPPPLRRHSSLPRLTVRSAVTSVGYREAAVPGAFRLHQFILSGAIEF
ncbi:hypothetical protein F2Q69_00011609 [Brassica cretica]|uniref:Uncharacterized protein n=1 Tax=Brassica cretica TaxID=69181 RepID=A0A8S9R2F8_BRACR|nr:hypothetical protein F2Q69_00011609 [Brassica cretica]